MNKMVYVVDIRNLILSNPSTLDRHLKYSAVLHLRTNNELRLGIIRFKRQRAATDESKGNLRILTYPANPFFMLKHVLTNKIKKNEKETVKVLIAGDPWESTVCAYFLKLVEFKTARIQVQIHGDIGNKSWIRLTKRNLVRSLVARFTLRLGYQYRTVGNIQTDFIISKYLIPRAKCRVIPVTSMYTNILIAHKTAKSTTPAIGFVGRLQSDRGISKFLDLVFKLRQQNLFFSVIVVGEGPEGSKLERNLEKILGRENVKFLGSLKQTEMGEAWAQIGILVSTAPTESFGRAIREAIAWGIPVWATPSSGVRDLQNEVSPLYVKDLNLDLPIDQQVKIYNDLLLAKVPLEVRKKIIEADGGALEALIGSWIEMCN